MLMRKLFPLYAIMVLIFGVVFSSIFAYPIFSKYTNLTASEVQELNNYHEIELEIPPGQPSSMVQNLNWFDVVNSLFPTYTKTRVIDIKSGKTYYVYRNGGHNHADVEPIDPANTDIFMSLYNYEASWARRPVWVEVTENCWVAGSINGYPHGKGYITGNNMDGHTCIHFLKSKTHGTKRVDESHQAAVEYAFTHGSELKNYL